MGFPLYTYLKDFFAFRRMYGSDEVEGRQKADLLLWKLVRGLKVPGLSITVLREGEIFFQKGYGFSDLDSGSRIDPKRTKFRIASVSKPIAATALAKMVEAGQMDLDASFYEYVPYYPRKEFDFTIRQLAGHTAGIRGYRGSEYGLNEHMSIKESIKIFKDDPLVFEPGTQYLYNSFDWVLISLAIQEVAGIPFEDYVRERVLKPFGMENTMAEMMGMGYKDTTTFYSKNRGCFKKAIPVTNFYKLAGGGYLSTSADIAMLGQRYLDGSAADEKVVAQLLSSQSVQGTPTHYGLGWQVSKDAQGRDFYGHVGNAVGGYSNFFVYPHQKMVFAILTNCTNPPIQETLDQVVDSLLTQENNTKGSGN
ncbi:MAG: serine hydrolase domain-containing protein [Sediminicola sp.]